MRAPLASVTLAAVAAAAADARADEPERRAAVALDVYRMSGVPGAESNYSTGSFSVAMLGAEVRVADRTWLAGSFGAALGAFSEDHFLRLGNPVLGVRTERRRGRLALRTGLDVALPLASVEVVDGDRSWNDLNTLRGAADARGRWNAWAWFPGWMSVVVPARLTASSDRKHQVALEIAGGMAYAARGEHAAATTAALGQIALDSSVRMTRRGAFEFRLAYVGVHAGGELERNGIVELGAAAELDGVRLHARLGFPFVRTRHHDAASTFLLGATWWTR